MPKPLNPLKRIDSLYDQCLGLLEKEVAHLAALAIVEKLPTSPAKDLRDIVKLLADMKDAQTEIMATKAAKKAAEAKQVDEATLMAAISNAGKAHKDK